MDAMNIVAKILRVLCVRDYLHALVRTGVFAATEHDDIIEGLALDTVIDLGANRGQFALCVRRLYPRAGIYSFEPLAKPARKFRSVFKHDVGVRLFNLAIGAQAGEAVMHVSRWDVSSSLLPIGQAQRNNFPFTAETRQEKVSVARLSDCVGASLIVGKAMLKLDVQGFELTALEGCDDLIERFRYVYVEASFVELYSGQALATELIAYLFGKGFELVCVANLSKGRSQRPIQGDFLFIRN
jgi:FkbM family methyltransferase